ncbi:chromatin-remodeling complex ATPase chain isw-1 [Drechmeria coniospora]|uniref:Chromatin-remodeling complex ATPase chain isw-1 n=1 Tax=Drechmeria coniospora TaxID=98403 RepID=A0A151GSP1_DRECN|nr:chromatin-remodeling complex ATPase chain isw-1 [Drechmeria coniospora]KYK60081.1 chromatin-remodeling complex ATPase chain isw-1 [Drechmeria coniospora]
MDGVRPDDPFLWGVEAVSKELCSLDRPCTHDPVALTKRIKEQEIDGHALLTFDLVCSSRELFESLAIKIGGQKASLGRAIVKLRSRSPAFRLWKQEFVKEQADELDEEEGPRLVEGLPATSLPTPASLESTGAAGQAPNNHRTLDLKRKLCAQLAASSGESAELSGQPSDVVDASTTMIEPSSVAPFARRQRENSPPKRLRVVPTLLAARPMNLLPLPVPTEADGVDADPARQDPSEQTDGYPWEHAASDAYLGQGVIALSAIRSAQETFTTQILEGEGEDFVTHFPVKLPAAWRMIAARVMKRLLMKNGRTEALLHAGFAPPSSSSALSEDDDRILDLLDLPDSPDEETLREMEAENAHAQLAAASRTVIERDRVEAILKDVIDEFRQYWDRQKLPKYLRKAYGIWTTARNKGTRIRQILQARERAMTYDARIRKLCAEMVAVAWTKESEIRHQARCLEQSLADKFYNLWLAEMLEMRLEPPKPTALPPHRRQKVERAPSPMGSEILTSSDEDELFVREEEGHQLAHAGEKGLAPEFATGHLPGPVIPAPSEESPCYVDLTCTDSPEMQDPHLAFVDLISPAKPGQAPPDDAISFSQITNATLPVPASADAEETLEGIEQIGAMSANHWAKLGDRTSLVLCILWKLGHARRSDVLDAARRTSSKALYDNVSAFVNRPAENMLELDGGGWETLAFDLTRVFLSYIKVKYCKEERVLALSSKDKARLRNGEGASWSRFHAFINQHAPLFPADSQIYRADAFDDEPIEMDETDAEVPGPDTPSKRRHAPKEIVQNQAAVDIRERENRRVEELEARRRKLRADLDTVGGMSRDKSRLIINEAKQEDQAFLYINDETAKRIKDHQIDGVRFLWNQIVLNDDVRQGCLLAHTMGLGKTMQVITFLVAIQEAAQSSDPSAREQIPNDLRESKTVILCPASLVDNWMDELLLWVPGDILGKIRKVSALMNPGERVEAIDAWSRDGGILVIGYNMLRKVVKISEGVAKSLLEHPNIVVADEAHYIKNPNTESNEICSRFKTKARVALTGSPLANNVEEYYSMIDWVAPNFLGPSKEFTQIYARPIHQGLWGDSTGAEKRRALKMLQVLKETVAPKVNRATIQCLRKDLPPKQEFVLCIQPTSLQTKLYERYLSELGIEYTGESATEAMPQSQIFSIVNDLMLLCNHPRCFRQKALGARQARQEGMPVSLTDRIITATLRETNAIKDMDSPCLSHKTELLTMILDEARTAREKVLVFTHSILTLDYLSNLFELQKRRVCRLDGTTKIGKRQDMIKSFNTGDQEIYLISTSAGGVGLNIHGASRVVIFDFKWNPVDEQQAIGRAYRIGQEKAVFVYRFVLAGTYEEDLQNKAVFKMQLASRVVDKKNPISWSKRHGSLLHSVVPVPARSLAEFAGKDRILDKLIDHDSDGATIRYIVSTDAFEEEDPTVNLTAEEQRETEDMVKLNRLRFADPDAYTHQWAMVCRHQMADFQPSHGQAPASVPRPGVGMAGLSLTQPTTAGQGWHGPSESPAPSSQPVQRRQEASSTPLLPPTEPFDSRPPPAAPSHDAMTSSEAPAAFHQPAASGPQSALSRYGGRPMVAWHAKVGVPQPTPGTNTYFGRESQPSPGLSTTVTPAGPAPSNAVSASGSGASMFSPPVRSEDRNDFVKILCRGPSLPGMAAGGRESTAESIATAIDRFRKEQAFGFLLDNQHWRLLKEFVGNERFALAIMSGHVTAVFLAAADRDELQRRLGILSSLSEGDFRGKLVAEAKAQDPHVCTEQGRSGDSVRHVRDADESARIY